MKAFNRTSVSKKAIIILNIISLLAGIIVCFLFFGVPYITYQSALADYRNDDFDEAIEKLESLNGYPGDASKKLIKAKFAKGNYLMEQASYDEAIMVYEDLMSNDISESQKQDASDFIAECKYQSCFERMDADPDMSAADLYEMARENYEDSRDLLDAVCTSEWLFSKLEFEDAALKMEEEPLYKEGYGEAAIGSRFRFHATFTVTNNGDVPVTGCFYVVTGLAAGGPLKAEVFCIDGTLYPGESQYCGTKPWEYEYEGGTGVAAEIVTFAAVPDDIPDGLEISYD